MSVTLTSLPHIPPLQPWEQDIDQEGRSLQFIDLPALDLRVQAGLRDLRRRSMDKSLPKGLRKKFIELYNTLSP